VTSDLQSWQTLQCFSVFPCFIFLDFILYWMVCIIYYMQFTKTFSVLHARCTAMASFVQTNLLCVCVLVLVCTGVFAPPPPLKTTPMMYTYVLDNRIVNLTIILHAPSVINRYFHVIYLSHDGSNWYSHLCLHTYYIQ